MVTEPDLYYPLNLRDKNTVRLFKADISPSVFDEIKVQKHFKFHGICVAEGKSTKHLKKQLESLDWKEIKLETCHGGMSLMDFTTLVRAVMVYMKDHYPTTPDEYNFQAELKAASHWYWYPKSNKNPGHEEGDRTSIKLPKLVSGPHKDKRIKIAALETCKKWISVLKELKTESSPHKRSKRVKEDEESSPEEDEIEERIYDLEESIFDLKTYFDFKESGIEEVDPACRGYFKFGTSTSALNQQNLETRQATSTYTMAQHVAPALDDVISKTVDIFHNYYKCDYPKSPQVKDGLKRLLNERYRDDVNSFIDHFVHPTQSLLSSLEEEKFPLCLPNGKVVLHLVPPMTKLTVGEFFYQVGHTNPRTLVVKFAKYEQRGTKVNELQRSKVPEDDHDIAFTKEYFDQIRGEVPDGLGDVLMRTLVVMGNPNWTVQREGAANHLGNCPTERHSRLRSESHLSVQESCDDDSGFMSEPNSPTENDDVYPSTDGVFVHTNGCDKGK